MYRDLESIPVITHFVFRTGRTLELSVQIEGETDNVIPKEREYHIFMKGVGKVTDVQLRSDTTLEYAHSYEQEKDELHICFHGGNEKQFTIHVQTESECAAAHDKTQCRMI